MTSELAAFSLSSAAPTAALKAPPLSLRGEGLGVGGHRLTPRPRPGRDPGPRSTPRANPTQKVPGHARDGVALALAALLLATPAAAQVIPTGTPAADILLSQAITEQRLFHTCSALDPQTHALVTDQWQQDAAAAVAILAENQVAPEAIAAFTEAASAKTLLPGPETPWAEVKGLCDTHPDWQTRLYQFDFIVLALRLPKAFE